MDHDGRKIIHIDMDAFYASVEQRDFPELRGKPIAVGGSRERGVVCTASYEARQFGVKSAMSSQKAIQLCPDIIFVPVRFPAYRAVSNQIREIFKSYTDLVEPLSMDEAYLDVTYNKKNINSAIEIANRIREDIFNQTQLTASAGISFNKFLAKTASDIQKPNGYTVVLPRHAQAFLDNLPIDKFHGIGKVTAVKMKKFDIHNGLNLRNQSQYFLSQNFGKSGLFYYNIVRGLDDREVNPIRIRKSISAENTFDNDIVEYHDIEQKIDNVIVSLLERIKRAGAHGLTVTLKIKYNDFTLRTISRTVQRPPETFEDFKNISIHLLNTTLINNKPIRLIGLGISNLIDQDAPIFEIQQSLFNINHNV